MFARWMLPKVGKKGLQEGVKTIKSFNPKKSKFKKKKNWKDLIDESNPSYKDKWPG